MLFYKFGSDLVIKLCANLFIIQKGIKTVFKIKWIYFMSCSLRRCFSCISFVYYRLSHFHLYMKQTFKRGCLSD